MSQQEDVMAHDAGHPDDVGLTEFTDAGELDTEERRA